jgi:hypothetical protein
MALEGPMVEGDERRLRHLSELPSKTSLEASTEKYGLVDSAVVEPPHQSKWPKCWT